MNQHTTPCAECPFRRDIKPGFLGGSPVEAYIGQSVLPFWLPCHCDRNYEQKTAMAKTGKITQCAGTAIFRANIGVGKRMPDSLLSLPPDKEKVFGTMAELVAHHKGIALDEAEVFLSNGKIRECMMNQLHDQQMRILEVQGKKV